MPGSPYFVYVEDGVVTGEGSSTTWAQVRDLMGQAVDDTAGGPPGPRARRRAGGTGGPGTATDGDDPVSIDRELLGAGIHPGHPSLYEPPEAAEAGQAAEADGGRPGALPSMSPATVALALGLPMAVVAAVRSTWSP